MMAADPEEQAAAFQLVRETTQRRTAAEQHAEAAIKEQTAAIQAAIAAGVSTLDLAEEAGMSRARIYQIRDGRR